MAQRLKHPSTNPRVFRDVYTRAIKGELGAQQADELLARYGLRPLTEKERRRVDAASLRRLQETGYGGAVGLVPPPGVKPSQPAPASAGGKGQHPSHNPGAYRSVVTRLHRGEINHAEADAHLQNAGLRRLTDAEKATAAKAVVAREHARAKAAPRAPSKVSTYQPAYPGTTTGGKRK
jgi:hypothetical protein